MFANSPRVRLGEHTHARTSASVNAGGCIGEREPRIGERERLALHWVEVDEAGPSSGEADEAGPSSGEAGEAGPSSGEAGIFLAFS